MNQYSRWPTAIAALAIVLASCGGGGTATSSTIPSTSTSSSPSTSQAPSTTPATTAEPASTTTTTATTTPPTTTSGPEAVEVTIVVADGQVDGPGRVTVPLGSVIRLTVESDMADEVHFHGYDLYADVAPDQPAEILVDADIPGVFEVELEGAGIELVLIQVE